MEPSSSESIAMVMGQEEDGRWWADVESMPGIIAYALTPEAASAAVQALTLPVAADCIDRG
jgi:hypothetical protein